MLLRRPRTHLDAATGLFQHPRVYAVYIMASGKNGTLYVGVTSDLTRRVFEHREGIVEGFTRKHDVKHLVYFEAFDDIQAAIESEKRVKRWRRAWKIQLVETNNPDWRDLYSELGV